MKSNIIILIVTILILALGAFWYYSTRTGNERPVTAVSAENQAQVHFQELVGELRPITFDTGIFSESRFMALVDLATPVSPETVGRIDPFARVSGGNGR